MENARSEFSPSATRVGVLGGGQLGKMLGIAAAPLSIPLYFLDPSAACPVSQIFRNVTTGEFKDEETVFEFGKDKDLITIEIEHVNVNALERLKVAGKIIHPDPAALRIIQDKGLQKEFYRDHGFPTSSFVLVSDASEIKSGLETEKIKFPFVQKTRKAGYDGKGVAIIRSEKDLGKLLEGPSVIEDLVRLKMEISVIVCRNASGEVASFPAVEMVFNPDANLVEFLVCPARISPKLEEKAASIASKLITELNVCGLLAVELFVDENEEIFINEVAPRPHNSGHHTIEAHTTSQYEQHLRGILNLPLGSTGVLSPSAMLNLLGAPGFSGNAVYNNLDEVMRIPGVKVHIYGKEKTAPFRKMGHVTILASTAEEALQKASEIKQKLTITA
jgi:5-(carboxyamino)imidazole ribonucleotide synthase